MTGWTMRWPTPRLGVYILLAALELRLGVGLLARRRGEIRQPGRWRRRRWQGQADGDELRVSRVNMESGSKENRADAHASLHPLSNGTENRKHYVISTAKLECAFSMTPAARISAAIEVLADIDARRRPASDALKDWGLSHRFAGSKDRAAIASLVYDALRRKASAAWIMGEATPRAIVLGMLPLQRGLTSEAIAALCSGERFAPEPLTRR